ncbi:MAG TPA: FHA domain-containing protein [Candidatus Dormibacteraeota bacterium]|nr:FHA domain-containing protein [Candidatus Dormibacteraeota bacterium]
MSLDLWLVVQGSGDETRDVAVRAQSQATTGEVAARLAAMVHPSSPAQAAWELYSHRRQAWLQAQAPVAGAGFQHGDIVAVAPAGTGTPRGAATARAGNAVMSLRFTAGPRVGTELQLPAGEYDIGRAGDAAIRIDDPFVESEHARLQVGRDRLVVTDLASATGTLVDGERIAGSRALRAGQAITVGGSTLQVTSHQVAVDGEQSPGAEVSFNRPPRVIVPAPSAVHRLEAPPSEPRPARLPIAAALLPLVLGGVLLLFYRSPLTLIFLALSPLLAIGSYLEGRLGGRGEYRKAVASFRTGLEELRRELAAARQAEIGRRREEAPDLRHLALAAHRREAWVWERRPHDDDFLEVRLALTTTPSRQHVEIEPGGAASLREEAGAALEPLAFVEDVPLILPLAERGTVGLAGPRQPVLDAARWMLVQSAVLHSPRNLSVCAALPREDIDDWDWLKWLPHTGESARQFEGPALCFDNASSRDLVERLADLLDARLAEVGPFRGTAARAPYSYVLAVLHEDIPLGRHTVTRLLAEGPRVGIVTLWLGSAVRDLPNECRAVVEVEAGGKVTLTFPAEGEVLTGAGTADRATTAEARQVALELAPLRDTAAGDARGELPRQVGLLDLLGLSPEPAAAEIVARWSVDQDGLGAPVGVSAGGHSRWTCAPMARTAWSEAPPARVSPSCCRAL